MFDQYAPFIYAAYGLMFAALSGVSIWVVLRWLKVRQELRNKKD